QRETRQLDPAMRAVGRTETKYQNQPDRADQQQTVNDATVLQLLIVELHREQHHDEADEYKNTLLQHVMKLVAVLLLSQDRGSAVDHHHAEEREPDGRREEPFIWSKFPSHYLKEGFTQGRKDDAKTQTNFASH